MLIDRRAFCAALPWVAAAAARPPAPSANLHVAAVGAGFAKFKYAGAVIEHDAATGTVDAAVVGLEIRSKKYDPKTSLPPQDLIERAAAAAVKLGAERLILNGRSCYDGHLDRDALTSKCIALNHAGRMCMSKRLGLRYRNGKGEFGGNALEMEFMMIRTNAELVGVALDVADVKHAGADMVNFFARHQQRMDCIFIREWDTVPYAPLAAEIERRQWQGWLVQEPAGAEERRALTRIFRV